MKRKKAIILIIEDDKILSNNLEILFKKHNYEVVTTISGKEGLKIANEDTPDLILCDIMLPDIDGYTVLEKLKSKKKTYLIPFIFLTAKAEMIDLRAGMNLGADDYITKPFKIDDLLQSVNIRIRKNIPFKLGNKSIFNSKRVIASAEYIYLDVGNNISTLKVNKIVCILSKGNYSFVYTADGKKYTFRKILKDWEAILSKSDFVRIHRSSIINIKYIQKMQKSINGTLKIYLHHFNEPLTISRGYRQNVKKNWLI